MADRKVQLPLESLDKCGSCSNASSNLKLCSYCGQAIYCSSECQSEDWLNHKKQCGKDKTDRIPLDIFYPFLVLLAECNRFYPAPQEHPAVKRYILNSPNPNAHPCKFPDGTEAKLVVLGDEIKPDELLSKKWWPAAQTEKVCAKLGRRFLREGNLFPLITAVLVSLLGEMYTSPYDSSSSSSKSLRRTRLSYKSSPIADFGIARGRANVTPQDRFAYWNIATDNFWIGQDPNDHYWIYFTTLKGEELIIDFGMFTFNMCTLAVCDPYIHPQSRMPPIAWAPTYFKDRPMAKHLPTLHFETKRASVLRNPDLHRFVCGRDISGIDPQNSAFKILWKFMESFVSRPLTPTERNLTANWVAVDTTWMRNTLQTRHWLSWPKDGPDMVIEQDPGELDNIPEDEAPWDLEDPRWADMKKINRKWNKGKLDRDELSRAWKKWKTRERK
ncbi:hypothetical protein GYMLUDRAFT_590292 [Collybiopsis luxurians FD-317 M1]|uniref:MYND-type domain-containing protein n=1 Tax=Collybiopsis luxurians FD-317 M1 TaxID=944289 RepID=A0A0D0BZ64_9AGAR|nr:hypothetical protein GYMLUDRAFT_590292 [Collybiopsis luxurians FD-317 M1]